MERTAHDWDVATSAYPAEVAELFSKTVMTGEKFGTISVLMPEGTVEVTTFRVEGAYRDARRPGSVEFVEDIEEDLGRRDFTMNAMAVSVFGKLSDPYGGLKDIGDRLIRCVGDADVRFREDALRMFRAYRFRAELGFSIEPATRRAIFANAEMAKLISAERIRVEFEKTLMSDMPEVAGEMIGAALLDRFITRTDKCGACMTERLRGLSRLPKESALRWVTFSVILREAGCIESAAEFLRDMSLDSRTIRMCLTASSIGDFPEERAGIKRLLSKHGTDAVRCAAAAREIVADTMEPPLCFSESPLCTTALLPTIDEIIASDECFSLDTLAVTGDDLIAMGYPPGRELGGMLNMLLDHVIECHEDNDRETLLSIILIHYGN